MRQKIDSNCQTRSYEKMWICAITLPNGMCVVTVISNMDGLILVVEVVVMVVVVVVVVVGEGGSFFFGFVRVFMSNLILFFGTCFFFSL